jgi:hypothetical protein
MEGAMVRSSALEVRRVVYSAGLTLLERENGMWLAKSWKNDAVAGIGRTPRQAIELACDGRVPAELVMFVEDCEAEA